MSSSSNDMSSPSVYLSGSISARLPASGNKKSKFKPAVPTPSKQESGRRTGLTSFSTPGFHIPKTQSVPQPLSRPNVVYISSDSAPPTPGPIKRDSSGLSVLDEHSPHRPKRQKVTSLDEKENVLITSSKVNHLVTKGTIPTHEKKYFDLASKSLETLRQYQIHGLGLRNYVADECLAFHNGLDKEKDLVLLEEIREVIRARLQAIETAKKALECRRQFDIIPEFNKVQTTLQTTTYPIQDLSYERTRLRQPVGPHSPHEIASIHDPNTSTTTCKGQASEDDYWAGMEDVSMLEQSLATTSGTSFLVSNVKDYADDSVDKSLTSTPYYAEVIHVLRKVFNLNTFRRNQLEAITAALDGRDVFVLMPTGGGKSLCFQLPAICTSGKTVGVTVVVSPLLALMNDQVASLLNKNIDALLSNSETVGEDWARLIKSERKPKLWYLTPEKLRDSAKVNEILSILHRGDKLARFVIDEAHCISTWGQDFRDAYTALGTLREKYPDVPIMALTATANKRTVADIISQLKLRNHAFFTQSFNRTNLKYTVQTKGGNFINEIVTFIQTKHRGKAGVIYCTARKKCETVAQALRDKGLNAAHFHANMPTQEKDQTVRDWQSGSVLIIVATIAFGMGIDKADVRFVIHHDMPKTMSGYYQETGRAGRDGKPADCLMFFSMGDLNILLKQIKSPDNNATQDSIRRQESAVREVYQFCENVSECRRVQILQHFDEKFTKGQCARGCDTCEDGRETVSEDVTSYVQATLELVILLVRERGDKVTLAQVKTILQGANTAEIRNKQYDKLPQYGTCAKLPKELVELMLKRIMFQEMLVNVSVANRSGYHTDYLELGSIGQIFLDTGRKLIVNWRPKPTREPKQRKKVPAGDPISAPSRSRKGKQKAVIDDDPILSDDMYDIDDADIAFLEDVDYSGVVPSLHTAATITPPTSSRSQPHNDSAEILYKKMITLRDEETRENVQESDVFDDCVLQYLSATSPSDYHSFKEGLAAAVEMDEPEAFQYIESRWNKYGQQFLQLCINHKTGMSSKLKSVAQVISSTSLHTMYDYRPPAGMVSKSSTPAVGQRPKSKFKPALPP